MLLDLNLRLRVFFQECQDERDWQKSKNHFYFYSYTTMGDSGLWECRDGCVALRGDNSQTDNFPARQIPFPHSRIQRFPQVWPTRVEGGKNVGIRKYWQNMMLWINCLLSNKWQILIGDFVINVEKTGGGYSTMEKLLLKMKEQNVWLEILMMWLPLHLDHNWSKVNEISGGRAGSVITYWYLRPNKLWLMKIELLSTIYFIKCIFKRSSTSTMH